MRVLASSQVINIAEEDNLLKIELMKKIILITVLAVLISGCQTADNSIGVGPITLSSYVKERFEEKYLKSPGPVHFIVSEDGRYSRYTYCAAGPGQCTSGFLVLDLIEKCEKRSGKKCFVFADGAHIVWDGIVSYEGTPNAQTKRKADLSSAIKIFDNAPPKDANLTSMNNWAVCGWAIKPSSEPLQWRTGEEYSAFVKQAHIRGFTRQFCTELLKTGSVEGLSDMILCKYALGSYGENPSWSFLGRFSHFYYEAERRGFTPKTCMALVPETEHKDKFSRNAKPEPILKRNGMTLTNKRLCAPALDIEQGEPRWGQYWGYKGYINEAKYRGLTAFSCHQATKAGAAINNVARKTEDYSDTELCNLSVILPDGKPVWSEHEDDQAYVEAAKARDLTPSSCIASPYVS